MARTLEIEVRPEPHRGPFFKKWYSAYYDGQTVPVPGTLSLTKRGCRKAAIDYFNDKKPKSYTYQIEVEDYDN